MEEQIEQWRSYLIRRDAIAPADVDELEGHLRDQIDGLAASGLSTDEAFLVAVSRMGRIDDLSREFARSIPIGSGSCSSPTVRRPAPTAGTASPSRSASASPLLVAIKIPALFGLTIGGDPQFLCAQPRAAHPPLPRRLFPGPPPLPRSPRSSPSPCRSPPTALVLNLYPFAADGATLPLAVLHSLVAAVDRHGDRLRQRRVALRPGADGLHPVHRRVVRLPRADRPRRRRPRRAHHRRLQHNRAGCRPGSSKSGSSPADSRAPWSSRDGSSRPSRASSRTSPRSSPGSSRRCSRRFCSYSSSRGSPRRPRGVADLESSNSATS